MSEYSDLVSRDRGILTSHDRKYLLGTLDDPPTDNAEYQKRFKIRERIRNAMFDFFIISRYLDEKDVNMLWAETDDWLYRSRRQRNWGDAPPYPDLPFLAKCWREIIAFFVYSQIATGIAESESLVEWVIEEGVNKGVRRHAFEAHHKYREVDSSLDWGIGDLYRLQVYLHHVSQEIPNNQEQAEEYLLRLQREGYLQRHHVHYLYHTYVKAA